MIALRINGVVREVEASADGSLLGVLRDDLGLTGAKYGCGEGQCGACMVLLGGQALASCIASVGSAAGMDVVTVEGIAASGRLHPLQQAFLDQEAFQCGYCTPGMLVAALGLLNHNPDPSRQEIVSALQLNLCRCGAYSRIVRAVQQAAGTLKSSAAAGAQN